MLHIFRTTIDPMSNALLRSMFAARKSVFIDLLGWDIAVFAGQYEMDRFDDDHATYLVLAGPDGAHLGSTRLLPTTRPHLLDSLYAQLCEEAPPRGPEIFEITRFCLDRGLPARVRRQVRDTLVRALADYAIGNGIAAYSAVAELGWLGQILAFGWHCRPLGQPETVEGRLLGALRIDITPDTPRLLAAQGIDPQARRCAGRTIAV